MFRKIPLFVLSRPMVIGSLSDGRGHGSGGQDAAPLNPRWYTLSIFGHQQRVFKHTKLHPIQSLKSETVSRSLLILSLLCMLFRYYSLGCLRESRMEQAAMPRAPKLGPSGFQ